jgi:hypothetical protein
MIFFNRNLVDYDQYSSHPPRSQPYLLLKSYSLSSYNTYSHFHPTALNPVHDTTFSENIAILEEEQFLVMKGSLSPYDQVRNYLDYFKKYFKVKIAPGSLEPYKRFKISLKEWTRLSHDLNIFEIDKRFRLSYIIT